MLTGVVRIHLNAFIRAKKWPWDDSRLGLASEAKSKHNIFQLVVTGATNLKLGKG